jgi:hypothetical protein
MILKLLQHDRNGPLELRVVNGRQILGQFCHLNVGRDAVAFHFPQSAGSGGDAMPWYSIAPLKGFWPST